MKKQSKSKQKHEASSPCYVLRPNWHAQCLLFFVIGCYVLTGDTLG